jgi:predicted transposase/invertase (TIGR01784 family)
MSSPHDGLFKATFSQIDLARSELELMLPKALQAQLDLATLELCPGSFVDPKLQQAHTDLLYSVSTKEGAPAFIHAIFEHQSGPDPTMAYRFLRYMVRDWERWFEQHPESKELPLVIPVLLHHGEGVWSTSTELAGMFAGAAALIEAARPFVPNFRLSVRVVDDGARR